MITQNELLNLLKTLSLKEIKMIVVRKRLKFSLPEISFYLNMMLAHHIKQVSFKSLHHEYCQKQEKNQPSVGYSTFMNNIMVISPLMKHLFKQFNKLFDIKSSSLVNMVDTTLIEEKKVESIHSKDWKKGRVTTRTKQEDAYDETHQTYVKTSIKYRICGSKGLIFLNRFNQIYEAQLLNINYSDQNILKDCSVYGHQLKGFLLADRGFNNKSVRERLNSIKNSIFQQEKMNCRLISPHHYKSKTTLSNKEKRLYKRRWKIETLFQRFKYHYSDNKLNLKGKYSQSLKQAKFYITLLLHNLSTIR